MSKITLNNVGDLTSTTTAQRTINSNFDIVENAFDNTLSRDGTSPNTMQSSLDMNSQRILNLPAPASLHDPIRLLEFEEAVLGQGIDAPFHITNTTQSTSTSTGAFVTDGGMGVAKDLYIGGTLHVGTFTASPTELDFQGTTSGTTVLKPTAVASGTLILPAATDTLVGKNTTDTLTNKTLTSPVINNPTVTGLTKNDVGLGNVDNTSDATKNSAVATLTNKTIDTASSNTIKINGNPLAASAGTGTITFPNSGGTVALLNGSQTFTGTKAFTPGTLALNGATSGQVLINAAAVAGSGTITVPSVGSGTDTFVTLGGSQNFTGTKNFSPGTLGLNGATSGTTLLNASATASGTLTLPAATDTLVGKATTDTLTNKTLTSPVINTPTGIVKGDVGLGNVDNTSDATKNSATATLTNKTLTSPIISTISNTGTLTLPTSTDTLVGRVTTDTLTNKTFDTASNTFKIKGVAAPSWTIDAGTVTSAASKVITVSGSPTSMVLRIEQYDPATTGTDLLMQINSDTGANYQYAYSTVGTAGTVTGAGGTAQTSIKLIPNVKLGFGARATVELNVPLNAAINKHMNYDSAATDTTSSLLVSIRGAGYWASTAAVTTITLFSSSGNISTMKYQLIGFA